MAPGEQIRRRKALGGGGRTSGNLLTLHGIRGARSRCSANRVLPPCFVHCADARPARCGLSPMRQYVARCGQVRRFQGNLQLCRNRLRGWEGDVNVAAIGCSTALEVGAERSEDTKYRFGRGRAVEPLAVASGSLSVSMSDSVSVSVSMLWSGQAGCRCWWW